MANDEHDAKEAWILATVEEFERPLCQYAARMLGDFDRARDVVQHVFLQLCRQDRRRIESRLKPWLFTVCRNRALDVRRKEKRMSPLNPEAQEAAASGDPTPPDALELRESAGAALAALATLPGNQQEVLRLKFQQGLSYRDISEVTQLTVSNVGYLIHTGLRRLREMLSPGSAMES